MVRSRPLPNGTVVAVFTEIEKTSEKKVPGRKPRVLCEI